LLALVTEKTNALVCKVDEVNELSGPGRGVTVIKVAPDDRVVAFLCSRVRAASISLETAKGRKLELSPGKYEVSSRGGKGREMSKKDTVRAVHRELSWVKLPESGEEGGR
jgi:DNA gyrase subunit A